VGERAARVVIAEDEAIIRLDLKEMLQEEGFDIVGEAADGEAAVRLALEAHPDLVIVDIKMPGLDGLSAAERIVEADLAPVLVLTAFSQKEFATRAARAGAMGFVVKPFEKTDLLAAIEVALARHAELAAARRESADLAGRLEARKAVDRAKARLMREEKLTEEAALRYLQQRAMHERRSLRSVADEVLRS
jgi:AmiR/NasT family two-component response regulator